MKYIWWKKIVVGPFSDKQLEKLNYERIEVLIDSLLERGFDTVEPMSPSMTANPNIPHIFYKHEQINS